jgi:hypothetical protein
MGDRLGIPSVVSFFLSDSHDEMSGNLKLSLIGEKVTIPQITLWDALFDALYYHIDVVLEKKLIIIQSVIDS